MTWIPTSQYLDVAPEEPAPICYHDWQWLQDEAVWKCSKCPLVVAVIVSIGGTMDSVLT